MARMRLLGRISYVISKGRAAAVRKLVEPITEIPAEQKEEDGTRWDELGEKLLSLGCCPYHHHICTEHVNDNVFVYEVFYEKALSSRPQEKQVPKFE